MVIYSTIFFTHPVTLPAQGEKEKRGYSHASDIPSFGIKEVS
jgi:hypothetical protein